jgi:hypothetical protein
MNLSEVLISVWRQSMTDLLPYVDVNGHRYPVQITSRHRLKQIDFEFEGKPLRALEQNPATKSRWAAMARSGSKVMQFLQDGRYIAVVCDGKLKLY